MLPILDAQCEQVIDLSSLYSAIHKADIIRDNFRQNHSDLSRIKRSDAKRLASDLLPTEVAAVEILKRMIHRSKMYDIQYPITCKSLELTLKETSTHIECIHVLLE